MIITVDLPVIIHQGCHTIWITRKCEGILKKIKTLRSFVNFKVEPSSIPRIYAYQLICFHIFYL